MALYHFSVKQVSRGKGQTVVNSAAYISGQKLYNDYYGQTHDYTKKSGVVFTEILTPEYAPERLSDRETLWNEVEQIEKSKRAQLAYSFDIALQNELTLDENIELAREFCREQCVRCKGHRIGAVIRPIGGNRSRGKDFLKIQCHVVLPPIKRSR